MSLKAFHIIFITVATLFCIAVAAWGLYFNATSTDAVIKIIGWACAIVAVVLPIYGVIFYRRYFTGPSHELNQ